MTQEDDTARRAIAEASPLVGWHQYPVFCGRYLIASMPNERLRTEFIARRAATYPASRYGTLPVR